MTIGWRSQFLERDWSEVRSFLCRVDWKDTRWSYLIEIIDSVVDAEATEVLAVTTSMHDLVVAPYPIEEPPFDVVVVAAPGSLRSHGPGTVRIDHVSVGGANTEIERPVEDAVSLFWKFVDVEFGIVRFGSADQG